MSDDKMTSFRWNSVEQKEMVKQKAERLGMSTSEYIRSVVSNDVLEDNLEADITRLKNDLESLHEEKKELEMELERVNNKIDTKENLITEKRNRIDERNTIADEVQEKLNYLASLEAIDVDSSYNKRAEEVAMSSDNFDNIEDVVDEAKSRADTVNVLEYLPKDKVEQQSEYTVSDLQGDDL